jgi:hypothetical protein
VIFPDGKRIILLAKGRLVNLGCGTGHPSYVMSSSFANQTIAQIELFTRGRLPGGRLHLPKHLDEKVARLQLKKLNAQLTELTDEQAAYIGVPAKAPTRPSTTATKTRMSGRATGKPPPLPPHELQAPLRQGQRTYGTVMTSSLPTPPF